MRENSYKYIKNLHGAFSEFGLTFLPQLHIIEMQEIFSLYTRAAERKFKRYVLSPDTGPLQSGFFIYERYWADGYLHLF